MNDEQLLRYSRHILLPELDVAGQQRLAQSKVLIVGLGGLGCPVAMYLAASGVGELWLADDDVVELSNLQRQIAHNTSDIGCSKVDSAAASVAALNPNVQLRKIHRRLDAAGFAAALADVDLAVDASDNFATRFALNQACFEAKKPLVSGAAIRGEGQLSVFDFRSSGSPCYRCLYSESDAGENLNCSDSGVLAPLVGVIGSLQALEALKCLAGIGQLLVGRLLLVDGLNMDIRQLTLTPDPQCPVCSSQ
ncbi:MAG: molybdopterin-synthase adenylyltransferase MoeB [Spongiibacteraceae bacterium]